MKSRRLFLKSTSLSVVSAATLLANPFSAAATEQKTATANDPSLFETIYSLRSIRRLKPDPIPEDTLRKIVEAGIHAPSGGNRQDWGFILVRDPELKRFIRDRYRDTQQKLQAGRPPLSALPPARQRAMKAGAYLAEQTIMWFKYEDGALLFTTTTDRVKFRNMQKDPRATLTVMDPTNMYKWVTIHGKFSIDNRDPAAFYRGLAEHYLTGDSLAAWKEMTVMDKRTVLKLTPAHIRAMGFPQK
jgi:PPOX class probable F420-dependent enzyme